MPGPSFDCGGGAVVRKSAQLSNRASSLFHETIGVDTTWTPKVCRIIAFWSIFPGFGLLFYLLLGSR